MKRFLSLIASAVLAVAALPAQASVSAPITINYTLPTQGCTTINGVTVSPCDNIPLTGGDAVTAVDVYISTSVIPDNFAGAPTTTVPAPSTGVSTNFTVNSGQTIHVRLKARIASGGVSAFTTEVTKTITTSVVPGVPTSVTITLNIT